ncbi:MAG: AAA family ATPase, partial [Solobacterium sp.]|nr:AAA family ATPase [Solobacterium sp.]
MDEPSKKRYILFLSSLLKDSAYVELCYMTGIMPINTYDTGTPLNMFREYTMAGNPRFSEFFDFTDSEVDDLYAKYRKVDENDAHITRDQLRDWYDGYYLNGSRCLYNPKAVINALNENYLTGYWSSSSKYEELYPFIAQNIDEVRDAIAVLISSEGYPARLNQYAAASEILKTKDQIFSAMVVYGFLTSDNGMVYIPNHELMEKFIEMLQYNKALGYLNTLAVASSRVVEATRKMNPGPIEEAIQLVHDKVIPLFKYNNEDALGYIVCLAYCAARDTHHFLREEKGGVGLADIILMPKNPSDDCFIIELKVDDSPQNAIRQIKKKRYYQ